MPDIRLRVALIVQVGFLALTAIAGGIELVAGANTPPVEMLGGSPFGSYTIPGLALLLVGGTALVATVLLVRGHPRGVAAAALAGAMIIGFEIVEVLVIGSPAGAAQNLQTFYFVLGVLILLLAVSLARQN